MNRTSFHWQMQPRRTTTFTETCACAACQPACGFQRSAVCLSLCMHTGCVCCYRCSQAMALHATCWPPHSTPAPRSMHPDPTKLRVLAELVIHPLAAAVEEAAAGVAVEGRQDARLQGLPPPMIPGVQDHAVSACYRLVRIVGRLYSQLLLAALAARQAPMCDAESICCCTHRRSSSRWSRRPEGLSTGLSAPRRPLLCCRSGAGLACSQVCSTGRLCGQDQEKWGPRAADAECELAVPPNACGHPQ